MSISDGDAALGRLRSKLVALSSAGQPLLTQIVIDSMLCDLGDIARSGGVASELNAWSEGAATPTRFELHDDPLASTVLGFVRDNPGTAKLDLRFALYHAAQQKGYGESEVCAEIIRLVADGQIVIEKDGPAHRHYTPEQITILHQPRARVVEMSRFRLPRNTPVVPAWQKPFVEQGAAQRPSVDPDLF